MEKTPETERLKAQMLETGLSGRLQDFFLQSSRWYAGWSFERKRQMRGVEDK